MDQRRCPITFDNCEAYRPALCKSYNMKTGKCKFGPNCIYSHGYLLYYYLIILATMNYYFILLSTKLECVDILKMDKSALEEHIAVMLMVLTYHFLEYLFFLFTYIFNNFVRS